MDRSRPLGRLHLRLVAQRAEGPLLVVATPMGPATGVLWQAAHLVLDGDFEPLHETVLGELRSTDRAHLALSSGGDDFHVLAWHGERALVAVPVPQEGTLASASSGRAEPVR